MSAEVLTVEELESLKRVKAALADECDRAELNELFKATADDFERVANALQRLTDAST